MLKHTSFDRRRALVLGMGISTASFAEMPSLDSQSYTWPGSTINTPAAIPTRSRPIRRPASGPASLTGRAWVPMCRGIPTSPAMIPRTAASASSPFRGKMPSSGKFPRPPGRKRAHPQGGALRKPLTSGRAEDKASPVPSKRNLSFCLQMEHDRNAPDRAIRRHGHRWRIGRPGGMGGKPCQTKHAFSSLTTTRTSVNCSPPTSPVTT